MLPINKIYYYCYYYSIFSDVLCEFQQRGLVPNMAAVCSQEMKIFYRHFHKFENTLVVSPMLLGNQDGDQ